MKNLLTLFLAGLMAVSSILLSGCCTPTQRHGHGNHKNHEQHSRMHHEHGDK